MYTSLKELYFIIEKKCEILCKYIRELDYK